MRNVAITQTDFSGGEVSPLLFGKTEDPRYTTGLAQSLDWLPRPDGPISNRPGTERFLSANSQSGGMRMIPFSPRVEEGFLLEFSDRALRVLRPEVSGQSRDELVVEGFADPFNGTYEFHRSDGSWSYYRKYESYGHYTEIGRNRFESVSRYNYLAFGNDGPDTFYFLYIYFYEADGDYWTYASGHEGQIPNFVRYNGSVSRVSSLAQLYAESDLQDVRYTKSGDVMYLTHRSYPPAILYRDSSGVWVYEVIPFSSGPYVEPTEEQAPITLSIDDYDYRVSIYSPGSDFSVLTSGHYLSYRHQNAFVLAKYIRLDGTSVDRAIVEPVKSIVSDLDPVARFEYQATSEFEYLGTIGFPTVSSDTTVFSGTLADSWLRFRDIGPSGSGATATWVQILNHLGTDVAGSGFFHHGGVNSAPVDVVSCTEALVGVPEFPDIQDVRATDIDGVLLNTTTVRSSDPLFSLSAEAEGPAADVGRFLQLEVAGVLLTCRILSDAANSYTQAKVSVDGGLPYGSESFILDSGRASSWRLGAYTPGNYPAACGIYNQRLLFSGTVSHPETLWCSKIGRYYDFSPKEQDLSVTASTAFSFTLGGQNSAPVRWLLPSTRLLIGTEGALWSAGGSGAGFTQGSLSLEKHDDLGSSVPPIQIGSTFLLIHLSGRQIREVEFSDDQKTYRADDGSTIPNYLFQQNGHQAVDISLQNTPTPLVWIRRADGFLVSLTPRWSRSTRSYGISRHRIGSEGLAIQEFLEDELGDTIVDELGDPIEMVTYKVGGQSPRCLDATPLFNFRQGRDSLFVATTRGAQRSIERMSFEYEPVDDMDRSGMLFVDGGTRLSSEEATTTWGDTDLLTYVGETVTILLDGVLWRSGYTMPDLPLVTPEASELVIGYPYLPTMKLLPMSNTSQYGNNGLQGRLREITSLLVMVHRTLGLRHGPVLGRAMIDENFKNNDDILSDTQLFTGTFEAPSHQRNSRTTEMFLQQALPYPCNILSVTLNGKVE